jgi:hypothetical protein
MAAPSLFEEASGRPSPILVTLDTNVLDVDRFSEVRSAVGDGAVSFATVTVNERERGGFSVELGVVPETGLWGESRLGEAVWGGPIPELLILDETPLGSGVLAGDEHAELFEHVLRIVSNGSFPPPGSRNALTAPQRRQLRDAMAFEAHCRQRRHLFVSDDRRAFINHGRRERLESLSETRILTSSEFIVFAMGGFTDA